jgi:hypothetical protein
VPDNRASTHCTCWLRTNQALYQTRPVTRIRTGTDHSSRQRTTSSLSWTSRPTVDRSEPAHLTLPTHEGFTFDTVNTTVSSKAWGYHPQSSSFSTLRTRLHLRVREHKAPLPHTQAAIDLVTAIEHPATVNTFSTTPIRPTRLVIIPRPPSRRCRHRELSKVDFATGRCWSHGRVLQERL